MGLVSDDLTTLESPYGCKEYKDNRFRYFYTLHTEYTTLDSRLNSPGVFPKRDIGLTFDMFPLVNNWCQVRVGPLLAKSPVELVFLSTMKGNPQKGTMTRVGLIRVSTKSAPAEYEGEALGEPLYGEIPSGDFSLWRAHHTPPVEAHARLVFPVGHRFPPAIMFDFKIHRPVACVPHLVTHLIDFLTPSSSSTPSPANNTSPRDSASEDRMVSYRTTGATNVNLSPLPQSFTSASVTTSSSLGGALSPPASRHLSSDVLDNRPALISSLTEASMSSRVPPRPFHPVSRVQAPFFASIESVIAHEPTNRGAPVTDEGSAARASSPPSVGTDFFSYAN